MWVINDLNVANRIYEYISPEAWEPISTLDFTVKHVN